jgi:hypothetical protein
VPNFVRAYNHVRSQSTYLHADFVTDAAVVIDNELNLLFPAVSLRSSALKQRVTRTLVLSVQNGPRRHITSRYQPHLTSARNISQSMAPQQTSRACPVCLPDIIGTASDYSTEPDTTHTLSCEIHGTSAMYQTAAMDATKADDAAIVNTSSGYGEQSNQDTQDTVAINQPIDVISQELPNINSKNDEFPIFYLAVSIITFLGIAFVGGIPWNEDIAYAS